MINLLRQGLSHGETHLRYCNTKDMVADLLTKMQFSSFKHFWFLRNALMGIKMKDTRWTYLEGLSEGSVAAL